MVSSFFVIASLNIDLRDITDSDFIDLYILGDRTDVLRFQNIHTVDHENGLFWDFGVSQRIIGITNQERFEKWGTTRAGLLTFIGHKILIETATTPCQTWLENIIPKYPDLKFVMYFITRPTHSQVECNVVEHCISYGLVWRPWNLQRLPILQYYYQYDYQCN